MEKLMNNLLKITTIALAFGTPLYAGGEHEGDHAAPKNEMAIGMPGDTMKTNRTISVIMSETDDGDMLFEPKSMEIMQGETIRFIVMNKGEFEHEFVIDTLEGNAKHKELMAQNDMEHDDPNSVRVDPGSSGEVIWKFTNAGTFEFGCLLPGHYESGMHGPIVVTEVTKNMWQRVLGAFSSGV
jgi:uncharacterized cupredoxin-like copper-binding protein